MCIQGTQVDQVYGKAGNRNQLETGSETGNWKWKQMEMQSLICCSASKIRMLLAFILRHPRALPASAF